METITKTSRRDFIKLGLATGGGLVLGFNWSSSSASSFDIINGSALPAGEVNFNSYLSISPDDVITIFSPNPELGQNIKTSFPMIVAEELEADWSKVKVLQAPLDSKRFERQLTGGSGAVPHSWERLRKAGATAKFMLMEAAAKKLGVPSSYLVAEFGKVHEPATGKSLTYGELATDAGKLEVPKEVKLKDRKDFKIIGTPVKIVDNKKWLPASLCTDLTSTAKACCML